MKESINTKSYNEYLWTNEIKKIVLITKLEYLRELVLSYNPIKF